MDTKHTNRHYIISYLDGTPWTCHIALQLASLERMAACHWSSEYDLTLDIPIRARLASPPRYAWWVARAIRGTVAMLRNGSLLLVHGVKSCIAVGLADPTYEERK